MAADKKLDFPIFFRYLDQTLFVENVWIVNSPRFPIEKFVNANLKVSALNPASIPFQKNTETNQQRRAYCIELVIWQLK